MLLLTLLAVVVGDNTYVQTPYIRTAEYAKGTSAPGGYTTGLIIGFAVAAALAVIGLIIGLIGTFKCVKEVIDEGKGEKFDEDDMEDIFDR